MEGLRRRGRRLVFKLVAANLIILFIPVIALITFRSWFLPQATALTAETHLKDMAILLARCGLPDAAPPGFHYAWLPDTGVGREAGGEGGLGLLEEHRKTATLRGGGTFSLPDQRAAVAHGKDGWYLVAEPLSRFEPDQLPHVRRISIVVQLTLLVAFILSLLLAWSILMPLQRLERVARQVADGRNPDPLPESGEDEVAEIAAALNRLLRRLHEQMAALSTYAAESSHRLRTGLTAIRGAAEMLESESLPLEARRRFLHNIEVEVGRMERALRDTLTLARLESEETALRRERFELCARLREVADSLGLLSPEVRIELPGVAGECSLVGDPERLEEAVTALMENAIKFAAPRGTVRLSLEQPSEQIVIAVDDSGPGVPSAVAPRLFDRFYTTGEPLPDGSPATGLGLSIARAIARLHGGEIRHERSSLGGARFVMVLPRGY